MVHRIGLIVASLAAAAVLAVALFAAGFAPGSAASVRPSAAAVAATGPSPSVQVDTVYIKPAPTQQIIQVPAAAGAGYEGSEQGEGGDHD